MGNTTKNLGSATSITSMLRTNSVFVEIDGSVRRISLDNLMNAINQGDEQLLRQVAWGVPLKQSIQTSPEWGRIGNITMWEEYKRMSGRYLVTNDGKAAKLAVSDSSVYADGTLLNETKGHIMVITPRLYYIVKEDAMSGIPYLWMSQVPIGGHYLEESVLGAYMGGMAGSALTSRSGLSPAGAKTINSFWNAAQVNGPDWGLVNYDHVRKIMMFALSEYGNADIQASLGHGVGGSGGYKDIWSAAAQLKTGPTKSLGDAFGKIDIEPLVNGEAQTTESSRVSILGIEDWYNWLYQMVQGVYFGSSENTAQTGSEAFIYEGNRMPTSTELTTQPAGSFRLLTRPTTNGYIKHETLGEYFDLIPTLLGGGSTSNWCDYFYGNTTGQLCLWGGIANNAAYCGCAYVCSNHAFSYAYSLFGSRLAYYGKLTYVDGKDIQ